MAVIAMDDLLKDKMALLPPDEEVNMTGQQLYDLYREKNAEQNCGTDTWGQLDQSYQQVWEAMADELNTRSGT